MSSVHVSTASTQDHATPAPFLLAVERQWGCRLIMDLAATKENAKRDRFYSPADNSLAQDWHTDLIQDQLRDADSAAWLNPPFRGVDPWMEKCKKESKRGARIVTLTLASLGTGWYRDHVEGNGATYVLRKRLVFIGQTDPFPKELMLTLWGFGLSGFGFWDPPAWATREAPKLELAPPAADEELWPLEQEA